MGKVLVTGSSGFLGTHVVAAFLNAGWLVLAGVRSQSDCHNLDHLDNNRQRLSKVLFDLSQKDSVIKAINDYQPQVIVHCAAYGVDYRQQNVSQALSINVDILPLWLTAAAESGVERVIHFGTAYEYGAYDSKISEDFALKPQGIYAASKAAASIIALERAAFLGLPLIELRPFTMFGPWEGQHKFVPQVISACRNKQYLELTAGEQLRDFVYVKDVAEACVSAAIQSDFPAGEVFNIASGQTLSLRGLGEMIADEVGHGRQWLGWGVRAYREDELMVCIADTRKARRLLNYTAVTALEEAVAKTVNNI